MVVLILNPLLKKLEPIFTLDYKVPSSTMENEMCLNKLSIFD